MECVICGKFNQGDHETGYAADLVCPTCADLGWTVDATGRVEREPVVLLIPTPAAEEDTECPF